MGTIHLIGPNSGGLRTARGYLMETNARYADFESVDASLRVAAPDLIILLADSDPARYAADIETLKGSRSHGSVKRLCILPFDLSMKRASKQVCDGEAELPMPLEKDKFLFSVGQCLNLPRRRTFSAIVTVQPEPGNLRFFGRSIDFSETGMSFECDTEFPINQLVKVSFGNPAMRLRLQLKAAVVRKYVSQTGKAFFHGLKYVDLTGEEKEQVLSFLSGLGAR